jgi:hypothetical protein
VQFDGSHGARGSQSLLALQISRQGLGKSRRKGKFLDNFLPPPETEQTQTYFGQWQDQRGAKNQLAILGRALAESAPFSRQWFQSFVHSSLTKFSLALPEFIGASGCSGLRVGSRPLVREQ